jgi:hypothetical protein
MGVPKIAINYGSAVPAGMSREEWEARVLLAASTACSPTSAGPS